MGTKHTRKRKPVLFYLALCISLFICGCAGNKRTHTDFTANLVNGYHAEAMNSLDSAKELPRGRDFMGYFLLYSDRTGPYYDKKRAEAYLNVLKTRYPESTFAACAVQIMSMLDITLSLEERISELKVQQEQANAENQKQKAKLTAAAAIQAQAQAAAQVQAQASAQAQIFAHSLAKSEENAKKLAEENKELNEKVKTLTKEAEQLRGQLAKMKEVDMKIGKNMIGE